MNVSRRAAVGLLSAAVLTGSAITGVTAFGHNGSPSNHGKHRGATVFASTMAPSLPSDPMLHGVSPGGLPWALRSGQARLRHDGRLTVRLRGLVLPGPPGNGTAGPITTVTASLYCGSDADPAAATTGSVPLSSSGDARIDQRVTLPATCLAPIILVHPNGGATAYIAVSGSRG
jgi:hypothetical protein